MELTAIEDYPQNSVATYSVWGTDGTGTDFCCLIDDVYTQNITAVQIYGTDYDDEVSFLYNGRTITHPDVASALTYDGDDIIVGSDGPNCEDVLWAYEGDNTVYGNDGNDVIITLEGVDTVFGDEGDDTIGLGDGVNYCEGGDGDDDITGGDNADTIDGGSGVDTIDGNDGHDTITGGPQGDIIDGGSSDDTIDGEGGDDTIDGGGGADVLKGGAGNDTLIGGLGADVLCGGGVDGSGHNTFFAAGVSFNESPNSVDKLWQPSVGGGSNTPVGTAQTGDRCGDSDIYSAWASNCTDNLPTAPTECN